MSALSEQPPPRRGAKAGYYPDPLGGKYARWWDGAGWQLRLGPRVSPDDPKNKAIAPPSKVCPHCGRRSKTFGSNCPHCGKGYERNTGTIVAAIVGAVLVTILLLGGCGLFIAALVRDTRHGTDKATISEQEFKSVPIGFGLADTEALLGRPFERDQFDEGAPRGVVTCTYYHRAGDRAYSDAYYGFCFAHGRLYTKRDHDDRAD